jgi:hypothetical protein
MFAIRRKSDRAFARLSAYIGDLNNVEVYISFSQFQDVFAVFQDKIDAEAIIDPSVWAGEHLKSCRAPARERDFRDAIAADDVEIVDLTPAT